MEIITQGQRRKNFDELEKFGQVGDWCFSDGCMSMWIRYPSIIDERGDLMRLFIQTGKSVYPRIWNWNGNMDAPTLDPSIQVTGQWHGYIRDGKLVTV